MISYVANILNLFATSVQNIVLATSIIGEIIISVLLWVSSLLISIYRNVLLFFQIVYEDNLIIFTEDLPNSADVVSETISNQFLSLWSSVAEVYYGAFIKLSTISSNVSWSIHATALCAREVLLLSKNTLVFVGNTVWFIITFVPIHLPELLQALTKYVFDIAVAKVVDWYMALLQFTNFLTEVPLESFLGISSFIVIVRLCIHFRTTIATQILLLYWSLLRNIMYYFYTFYNYFVNSEVRVITRMANGEELRTEAENFENILYDEAENAADTLCVICQEHQKCVLTLPCRHVCLCADCCRRLYGYQRTCPICRTFIYHSVTVYL